MVSPTRLTEKLVFHSFDKTTAENDLTLDWDFAWARRPNVKRVCLRLMRTSFASSSVQTYIGLRQHMGPQSYMGWDFLPQVSPRYAPALAALLPPEELARFTRVRLGVRNG